jgi:hypothetical protein
MLRNAFCTAADAALASSVRLASESAMTAAAGFDWPWLTVDCFRFLPTGKYPGKAAVSKSAAAAAPSVSVSRSGGFGLLSLLPSDASAG